MQIEAEGPGCYSRVIMERVAFAEWECRSLRLTASRLVCLPGCVHTDMVAFFDFGRTRDLNPKREACVWASLAVKRRGAGGGWRGLGFLGGGGALL